MMDSQILPALLTCVYAHFCLIYSLLGQLLSFTDQLFQGQPCGSLRWNPPPMIESSEFIKWHVPYWEYIRSTPGLYA